MITIPWLRWTNGLSLPQATLLYMLGLAAFLGTVTVLQLTTNSDFVLPPIGPERRGWITALVGHVLSQGAALASLLFIWRGFHQDLAVLEPAAILPQTSRMAYGVEAAAGVIAGYLLNLASANAMNGPNSSGTFFGATNIWLGLDITI